MDRESIRNWFSRRRRRGPVLIANVENQYWLYDFGDGLYGLGVFDPGGSRTLPPMTMEEVIRELVAIARTPGSGWFRP
jgi:hypothetical protein